MTEWVQSLSHPEQVSLRDLGQALGVTAAYVADIESNRRLPSPELKQKLAAALDIPLDDLEEADNRLSPDLHDWVEERPQVVNLLRSLRTSPQSEKLVQRLDRFLKRHNPPPARGFLPKSAARAVGIAPSCCYQSA